SSNSREVSKISNVSNVSVALDDATITNNANITNFPTLPYFVDGIDIGPLLNKHQPGVSL
ncbi:MAG: hypothetical protein PHV39_06210, partial [Methanomicrobium sp.]|nr:hypothetical protein [Methanomicrobium sp.]